MFSYLRYFFITSIILLIASTTFLSWYHGTSSDEIILEQTEKSNIALAKSYSNTVWFKHKDIIRIIYEYAPDERSEYKEFVEFGRDSAHYLQDMPIIKFNLYAPDGSLFYSTNQGTINITESYDVTPVQGEMSDMMTPQIAARSASVLSEIVHDAEYFDIAGRRRTGNLVRTLIPIYSEEYVGVVADQQPRSDAVLEVFYDVNDTSVSLKSFQYTATGFIVVIFLILYAILFFTTRRAEGIIEKQHDTNVELSNAKVKAEASSEQKSQFLANISHELRTPLNAIIGFSEIIKDEVMGELGNEQYKNYVKDIHSSGVHLLSLINDILDYSKAEAGKLDMEYELVDLNKLIMACLRLQEPRAQSGEIKLTKLLPSEHITIRTDTKRLKQVLLNLLSNAVKFTPPHGEVSISAWLNVSDGKIGIQVQDTGIGIAPKDIAKALSPFGQVDSDLSRRYEGTGLGLPLTKKFVELLGGKLQLDSEEGKGTKISIFLPKDGDQESVKNVMDSETAEEENKEEDSNENNQIDSNTENSNNETAENNIESEQEETSKKFKLGWKKKKQAEPPLEENIPAQESTQPAIAAEDISDMQPQTAEHESTQEFAGAPTVEADQSIATNEPVSQPIQSQDSVQGAPAEQPQDIPSNMYNPQPDQPLPESNEANNQPQNPQAAQPTYSPEPETPQTVQPEPVQQQTYQPAQPQTTAPQQQGFGALPADNIPATQNSDSTNQIDSAAVPQQNMQAQDQQTYTPNQSMHPQSPTAQSVPINPAAEPQQNDFSTAPVFKTSDLPDQKPNTEQ